MAKYNRVFVLVVDSLGVGAMPDSEKFGDFGVNTLQHISNLYYTEPCAKLAQMLCDKTGMGKVFFSNSGAEAIRNNA